MAVLQQELLLALQLGLVAKALPEDLEVNLERGVRVIEEALEDPDHQNLEVEVEAQKGAEATHQDQREKKVQYQIIMKREARALARKQMVQGLEVTHQHHKGVIQNNALKRK